MPWECKTVEKQRLEFVTKALETNNFSALCREYEITRKTGRKWVDRFKQGLPLTDMSRRPLCSPNKTPDDIEELIVSVRFDNPGWGDDKIKIFLENQGYKTFLVQEPLLTFFINTNSYLKRNRSKESLLNAFRKNIAMICGKLISRESF